MREWMECGETAPGFPPAFAGLNPGYKLIWRHAGPRWQRLPDVRPLRGRHPGYNGC